MLPYVTILICNYNYSEWVCDAIDSAIAQDYPKDRFSLCIVDDCSTDDSVKIIRERLNFKEEKYSNKDEIVYQNEHLLISLLKNGGPSRARNQGIKKTLEKTDYYLILDADDIIFPDKISSMVSAIKDRKSIGVVYGDYINWDIHKNLEFPEYKESYNFNRLRQECIVHSGSLVNKDALLSVAQNGQFFSEDLRVCEDYDLWLQIGLKWLILHIPKILGKSRVTMKNSTNTVKSEVWQSCWRKVQERINVRIQNQR